MSSSSSSCSSISLTANSKEEELLYSTKTCPLCCEEKPLPALFTLSKCSHESCQSCLIKWIEKAEISGQTTPPGCPFCRTEITCQEEILTILGRPFQPKIFINSGVEGAAATASAAELDEFTLQWLREQTKQCPGCGSYIEKIPGGCDMMECLCGHRFCYSCGAQGARCSCTPEFHRFWDNVLDRQAEINPPPRAEATATVSSSETGGGGSMLGVVDLKKHITQRKHEDHSKQIRQQRIERREQQAHERLEEVHCSSVWLFCAAKKESSIKVLKQILRGQSIRWVRGRKRMEEDKEQQELIFYGGQWLYHTKDSGYQVMQSMYSSKAIKTRGRRAKVRMNNGIQPKGVDAAFSSGKWLYYCRENSKTVVQVENFSKHQMNETGVHFDRWFLGDDFWCGCGDWDCDDCIDFEDQIKENAINIRLLFLQDEETKALEMEEIKKNGL